MSFTTLMILCPKWHKVIGNDMKIVVVQNYRAKVVDEKKTNIIKIML